VPDRPGTREELSCLIAEREAGPDLAAVVAAEDLAPLPVRSLDEVAAAFRIAAGGFVETRLTVEVAPDAGLVMCPVRRAGAFGGEGEQDDELHIRTLAALAALAASLGGSAAATAGEVEIFDRSVPAPADLARILWSDGAAAGAPSRTRGIRMKEPAGAAAPAEAKAFGFLVRFGFDSAEVLPESRPYLDSVGGMLRLPEAAGKRVAIVGHTDASGPEGYNRSLSERRAGRRPQLPERQVRDRRRASRGGGHGRGRAAPRPRSRGARATGGSSSTPLPDGLGRGRGGRLDPAQPPVTARRSSQPSRAGASAGSPL
jgi:outer membrane protein OmpA-like peptidoglycan-associated protein